MNVLTRQISKLCIAKNCFLYEGRLYERMYNRECKLKFRFMISDDDYDYIDDKSHEAKLIRVFRNLKRSK